MNAEALASMGILIIATRGPLILAPEGTLRVYRSVLATSGRVRAMGCVLAPFGLAALLATEGAEGTLSHVIAFFGWALIAGSVFLLVLPGAYQRFAWSILDAFDTAALRMTGVLGAGIGLLFVYYGAAGWS